MPDEDAIERRLAAVERALTDGHDDPAALRQDAAVAARVDELEATTVDLERRVADLDAAVQALRGYVGNVRSVNRAVERRAEAALAVADDTSPEGRADRNDRTRGADAPDDNDDAIDAQEDARHATAVDPARE